MKLFSPFSQKLSMSALVMHFTDRFFKSIFLFAGVFLCITLKAQPLKVWDRSLGGTASDIMKDIRQTADGGYIMAGYSWSIITYTPPVTFQDIYVAKLSANGTKQWDRRLGSGVESIGSILQMADGGYLVAGGSAANAGGDKTENSKGEHDFWLVKLGPDGTKLWDKTIGGPGIDVVVNCEPTADGGAIVGGVTFSGIGGDKGSPAYGEDDLWIVKVDANGSVQWEKAIGGNTMDVFKKVSPTPDGGYLVAGWTWSGISGNKTSALKGEADYWVIKLNANGNIEWDKTIGALYGDYLYSMEVTSDGGAILSGTTWSGPGGDKTGDKKGITGYWIVKLASDGSIQWDKDLGSSASGGFGYIVQMADGSYISAADVGLPVDGDKTVVSKGGGDFWLVKLDASGNKIWDTVFGGTEYESIRCFRRTSDNGFVMGGVSVSGIGADKTEQAFGSEDFWIIKTTDEDRLPVTLSKFNGKNEGTTALLYWETTSETGSERFEIEHSFDGKSWNTIGSVKAAATSSVIRHYDFKDNSPSLQRVNLYRLKMIDYDETYAYSAIATVKFGIVPEMVLYPNPTAQVLNLSLADFPHVKSIQIINEKAVRVYDSGTAPTSQIDVSNLLSGNYVVRVIRTDGSSHSQKIVVARH
ncbi:Por secretion system C-terminal sorting domain-containing protein [Dyadobacter soli]|uniref:Por secretion system C-terminal sorting domain-containing protein n=2 Tax=Dyadobacter soli TaxID=659014 RepID=A0A1G8CVW5_9BACT|nr:Por secretion system C-terminal sorting domain-containing protein [Dyadobacter soli]